MVSQSDPPDRIDADSDGNELNPLNNNIDDAFVIVLLIRHNDAPSDAIGADCAGDDVDDDVHLQGLHARTYAHANVLSHAQQQK